MQISQETIEKVIKILNEEIVAAEGCTEPIALALVGAKAKELLGDVPTKVDIYVSGNIIKNVKSVIVPNSGGKVGLEVSAAMGIIAGKPEKDLMVISHVTPEIMATVNQFMQDTEINVIHEKCDDKLYIRVELFTKDSSAVVEVRHLHTNVTKMVKNGETLKKNACHEEYNTPITDRSVLSVELIYELAKTIDIKLIEPIFDKVITCNSRIANEGLKGTYGVNIGQSIMKNMELGIYGTDRRNKCASFAAAGSDARMSGCPLPVMTTSGSGNQGMTASLPIIKYCEDKNLPKETLVRALFLSHLTTIHIKTEVGALSAYCGAICASAGVGGAIVYLLNGTLDEVGRAIINTLANVSGVICDGAKASCAMKIASGIYTAFDSATLAYFHKDLNYGDGIVGKNIEETIKNIGTLAKIGMKETDEVILKIMTNSKIEE